MEAYVMDAFSTRVFGGNQAGVVLPDRPLSDAVMRQIAAEFKHSETAFVTRGAGRLRVPAVFHPRGRGGAVRPRHGGVLCPAAAAGTHRRRRRDGHTRAGELTVTVRGDTVWMDMAKPQLLAGAGRGRGRLL